MKHDNHMKSRLKSAFEGVTPNVLDSILASCHNTKGRIIPMKKEKKFSKFTKAAIACAACFAMVVGCMAGYTAFQKNPKAITPSPADKTPVETQIQTPEKIVATIVTLDVNPSLEIQVDEDETVMNVLALNEDAKTVVGTMDFEGISLEVTVNALIGSMLQKGYLNETTSDILVSVDNKDGTTAAAIKDKLSGEIAALFERNHLEGEVIGQTVSSEDNELAALAEQYGITIGKAKLIQTIVKMNPESTFADYASLSVTKLNRIMNTSAEKPADTDVYIGEAKALEIALEELNLTMDDLDEYPEIELVVLRGQVLYDIFIKTSDYVDETHYSISHFHYYVNAFADKAPTDGITEPNITMDEAWSCVCEQLGEDAKDVKLLDKVFHDMESGLPMTYSFHFEIGGTEYTALVDAMDGTVIRIVEW